MWKPKKNNASVTFKIGAIALAFLTIGFESALFLHKATQLRIAEKRDNPDTVYIIEKIPLPAPEGSARIVSTGKAGLDTGTTIRYSMAKHGPEIEKARERIPKKAETFRFDPNTVSVEDLQRLGFSEKQALSIDAYRKKGGKFRRRTDFAKSYVVSDSVYKRLENHIIIPVTDINKADSAAFDALPGIGGWFASRMVSYRNELGGYSYPEQLMDIYRFDKEKYDALSDLISCSPPEKPFRLWSLPAEELQKHPYIRSWNVARAIVLYRDNNPPEKMTVNGLENAGIIDSETSAKLSRCFIASP